MKTIAMMTLLAGTIAVGIAPAAEARDNHDSKRFNQTRHDSNDRNHDVRRHGSNDRNHDVRRHDDRANHKRHDRRDVLARQQREVRHLANRLERATNALRAEARESARRNDRYNGRHNGRRINRYEARALHAVLRLEQAADRFRREAHVRKAFGRRELSRELRNVEEAFRSARYQARALPRSRELHRDFRRVGQLIAELDDGVGHRDHFAGLFGRFHIAQR